MNEIILKTQLINFYNYVIFIDCFSIDKVCIKGIKCVGNKFDNKILFLLYQGFCDKYILGIVSRLGI